MYENDFQFATSKLAFSEESQIDVINFYKVKIKIAQRSMREERCIQCKLSKSNHLHQRH
jgi:hypothetical protein